MLQAILYDRATGDTIADLTEFSTITLAPRLRGPRGVTVKLPGDTEAIRGMFDDGYPVAQVGRRGIKTYLDETLRGNEILWNLAPSGDENKTEIVLTGWDPRVLFESRFVYVDGNLADPHFPSPISGAEMLKTALEGSNEALQDTSPASIAELPIDLDSGTFDTEIPPAVDLSAQLTDFPMRISELYALILATGAVDVILDPAEGFLGSGRDKLGVLSVVNHYGSDLSGTVHFDYATGLYNIARARRTFDMGQLCNRLWYFLAPKITESRYKGNITATEAGLEDYYDLQIASREKYLDVYEDIRIFDVDGDHPLRDPTQNRIWHALWKQEVVLRTEAPQMLYVTPVASADPSDQPFSPFVDYDLGDLVAGNIADIIGPEAAGVKQRIYGFDLTQEANGPVRVSEFIVSPDGVA